jgi:hypothetical protein
VTLRRPATWLQGRRARVGPENTLPRWGEVGVHGIHRLREWDEIVMVEADGPLEEDVELVVLPDGRVAGGDPDEAELAAAIPFEPPYRAHAVLRGLKLWAVAARRVRVARFDHPGDEIELAVREGETSLLVDGVPRSGGVPALEALLHGDGVVRATRIADDVWEVRADRL